MFDEEKAIEYIRSGFPGITLEEDDLLFIIDCIWDYYEDNGLLDINDSDEPDNEDIDALAGYVENAVRKDGQLKIEESLLRGIILKEIEYEKSVEEDF